MDRDNPGGYCDCETLAEMIKENKPGLCEKPLLMEGRRRYDKMSINDITGVVFRDNSPTVGLTCFNADQKSRRCDDYEVRFCCPKGKHRRKRSLS